jgi:hypothetical protein
MAYVLLFLYLSPGLTIPPNEASSCLIARRVHCAGCGLAVDINTAIDFDLSLLGLDHSWSTGNTLRARPSTCRINWKISSAANFWHKGCWAKVTTRRLCSAISNVCLPRLVPVGRLIFSRRLKYFPVVVVAWYAGMLYHPHQVRQFTWI